ncbi:MAG TPA: VTT domain-containing protein [Xanthobacteraceae bacterium]|nr:VTT domain-containing protein [Xanthobacteraceae bacterium]
MSQASARKIPADVHPLIRGNSGHAESPPAILRPGRNVWRVEHADRAAVLVDGAAFFRAVRAAFRKAERNVFIVGWDINSRCRLVGEDGETDDGLPATLSEFISALARRRPELRFHLLLWDYSVVYALERELFPTVSLHWATPRQVRLCLDDELPMGSAHHQKIIVVDDSVAFVGGFDLTVRRWDTSDHSLDNPQRVDPAGAPYRPFHDVQILVDGAAARALAKLVRARWAQASLDVPSELMPCGDVWPDGIEPDMRNVDVGIARTLPVYGGHPEVREVEALFYDSISAARRTIYIENQFVTCTKLGEHLARTLRERPGLEAVVIVPRTYSSWIEERTMRSGRARFVALMRAAGVAARVRLLYPHTEAHGRVCDTMVHSKVCIIDDDLLRIGSANLNNRSMGTDTECDLAVQARDDLQRQGIAQVRNRLVADHCGTRVGEVGAVMNRTGSLIETVESVSRNGHVLRPIDDGQAVGEDLTLPIDGLADPERPLMPEFAIGGTRARLSRKQISTLIKVGLAALLILALPLAWQYTPLSNLAAPEAVRAGLLRITGGFWAPLAVIAAFVIAGFVAFPVTVLIAVTAATFGPVFGFLYAGAGALASALVVYLVGAWAGKEVVRDLLGPRLDRIRRRIVRRGVIAVALIRLVPVAPFTFVNLVAGASQIRLHEYLLGTLLGMTPGLLVMSALGAQIFEILRNPTAENVAILGACVVGWIALSVGIQILVSRLRRGAS